MYFMLVLSRKIDESIHIGENIEVMVVKVKGESVRLGITAPKNVTVHRSEVYKAIERERTLYEPPGQVQGLDYTINGQ